MIAKLALVSIVTFCLWGFGLASLIVHHPSNTTETSYLSANLQFDANPLVFNPVNGFLVLTNMTDAFIDNYFRANPSETTLPPLVLAELWPGYTRPYIEQRLVSWKTRFGEQLVAAVILGEYALGGVSWELGALDQIRLGGFSTRNATYPLIQTRWQVWFDLRARLLNGSLINVTVTDQGGNPWKSLRSGGWYAVWISICILWCLVNISLASYALSKYPCKRILAVVVLSLEIASNLLRLPFLIDPFGVWFMPIPIIQIAFSMSWPIHASVAILVIFFWMELVTSRNIKSKAGFLTTRRWPAAIVIVIVVLAEYITSALRAVGLSSVTLTLNAAIYVIVLLSCVGIYVYTYILVVSFFRGSTVLRSKDAMLKAVSFRFLLTAGTFVCMVITGIFVVTPYYGTALGMSLVHFLMYVFINLGSSCTISAFVDRASASSSSKASLSSSKGENSQQAQPGSYSLRDSI